MAYASGIGGAPAVTTVIGGRFAPGVIPIQVADELRPGATHSITVDGGTYPVTIDGAGMGTVNVTITTPGSYQVDLVIAGVGTINFPGAVVVVTPDRAFHDGLGGVVPQQWLSS